MLISVILFYLFSFLAILSAVMVISSKNPVHSVFFLILAFFNSAGLFLLLGAELLAMLLIIVYVGAVAVLFLFVVMMLNINFAKMKEGLLRHMPLGILVAALLVGELLFVIYWSPLGQAPIPLESVASAKTNTEAIGNVLYTDYAFLFQLAGLILLVAMIGAIVLTHRQREGVKRQDKQKQISRKREDTIEIVRIKSGRGI